MNADLLDQRFLANNALRSYPQPNRTIHIQNISIMPKSTGQAKFKSTLTKSASGWYFLTVSAEIANRFKTDARTRRVVCTLNESHTFQCALLGIGKGEFAIAVSKPLRQKLAVTEGSIMTIWLEKDTSRYGLPMPEELNEVMCQDPEGDRFFHALTPGNQRLIIHIVDSVKNVDKRIHFALLTMEHLKASDGKFVYDALHKSLRRPLI